MPRRSLTVCSTPSCAELTSGGRCAVCRREAERQRGSASQRGYDAAWQRTRAAYLKNHPRCECEDCEALPYEQRPAATDVDHIDGLGPNGPRGHDPSNLRALTKSHHSRRTARDQPGGWNAR
ncbi:HNH endonuclease [Nonomuraea phyllanthi]|uniref:HNH endonuclease n=1 Tax=Nonomuraea phyllanthi TaxID=2219224 RepID=A0A5C4V7L0_9ACTN|nr:HNH endonuclease [Nonomuraea phyllanthi]